MNDQNAEDKDLASHEEFDALSLFKTIQAEAQSLLQHSRIILQTQIDLAKLSALQFLFKLITLIFLGIVGIGIIFFSVYLTLMGISLGLSRVLENQLWISHLIVGLSILIFFGITLSVGIKKMKLSHYKKTLEKYETQ